MKMTLVYYLKTEVYIKGCLSKITKNKQSQINVETAIHNTPE